jgi:hypothetical protein
LYFTPNGVASHPKSAPADFSLVRRRAKEMNAQAAVIKGKMIKKNKI